MFIAVGVGGDAVGWRTIIFPQKVERRRVQKHMKDQFLKIGSSANKEYTFFGVFWHTGVRSVRNRVLIKSV